MVHDGLVLGRIVPGSIGDGLEIIRDYGHSGSNDALFLQSLVRKSSRQDGLLTRAAKIRQS